jgi:hypothetical protein
MNAFCARLLETDKIYWAMAAGRYWVSAGGKSNVEVIPF